MGSPQSQLLCLPPASERDLDNPAAASLLPFNIKNLPSAADG